MRVAAVGTGYFSQFHYEAWTRSHDVSIVGVCGLDTDAVQRQADAVEAQAFSDAATMLDETRPDLLDIITPPDTHLQFIELAAERSVNVICQKPFCGNLESAQKAVQIAEDAGIDLIVHENFRFQPWYRKIKALVDSNKLGPLYRVSFRLRPGDGQGRNAYLDRQPYFQKMERFLIHETAIHYIDVMRYLFGEVKSVWADLERLNPHIRGEDSGIVVLTFEQSLKGILDGNRLSDHPATNRRRTMGEMTVEGEAGALSLNGNGELFFRPFGEDVFQPISYDWNDHGFGGDCVFAFTRYVIDHYLEDRPLENDGRSYLANLKIEEAIYRSANSGTVQHFPFDPSSI